MYYSFDWGDGNNSGWIGPVKSNEIIEVSHNWKNKDSYEIKVKAKDIHGKESKWSDPLSISIIKSKSSKSIQFPLFKNFLVHFTLLKQIFQRLFLIYD